MLCPPSMKFHVTASPAFTATFFGLKLSFWADTLAGAATAGVAKAQAAMPALAKDIDAGSRTALSSQEVVTAGTKDRAETPARARRSSRPRYPMPLPGCDRAHRTFVQRPCRGGRAAAPARGRSGRRRLEEAGDVAQAPVVGERGEVDPGGERAASVGREELPAEPDAVVVGVRARRELEAVAGEALLHPGDHRVDPVGAVARHARIEVGGVVGPGL